MPPYTCTFPCSFAPRGSLAQPIYCTYCSVFWEVRGNWREHHTDTGRTLTVTRTQNHNRVPTMSHIHVMLVFFLSEKIHFWPLSSILLIMAMRSPNSTADYEESCTYTIAGKQNRDIICNYKTVHVWLKKKKVPVVHSYSDVQLSKTTGFSTHYEVFASFMSQLLCPTH